MGSVSSPGDRTSESGPVVSSGARGMCTFSVGFEVGDEDPASLAAAEVWRSGELRIEAPDSGPDGTRPAYPAEGLGGGETAEESARSAPFCRLLCACGDVRVVPMAPTGTRVSLATLKWTLPFWTHSGGICAHCSSGGFSR